MKRILVVGGGLIGARHVVSAAAHDKCILAGLVDPRQEVGAQYGSMTEVNGPVDGVIIATPTHLHAEQGRYAAQRGWDLLIEKPEASDLSQAGALAAAVSAAGVASLVGHHRRYHAPVQQLKSLITGGLIGTPVCANLIWAMRKPDSYFDDNWRTLDGSPVMINLVHDIDLLRFVIGEIATTTAVRGAGQRSDTRIESGAVALAFENVATGTISFADTTPSPWGFEAGSGENPNIGTTGQDMMWVMGTKGAISFPSMTLWSGTDWGTASARQPLKPVQNTKSPLDAQLDHFIDVMDGAEPLIDVADATRTLAIALQIESQLAIQGEGTTHVRSANA